MSRFLEFSDLLNMQRAGAARVSAGGDVVFTVATPDLDKNRNQTDLFLIINGDGDPARLTHSGSANREPAVSPDGRSLAFVSNRSGSDQVWILPLDGGEARQVGDFPMGARQPVWFPDGAHLLVAASVYADLKTLDEMKDRYQDRRKHAPSPRLIDDLMFRHWDAWTEDQVEHLFKVSAATGEAEDLTPGPFPAPPRSLSGSPEYAVSPSGDEICFVSLRDENQATSTNLNLWLLPSAGGEPKRISPWEGCNVYPVYSPDGKFIAYSGMRRAGYEADRMELLVYDRGSKTLREVAPEFDRNVGPVQWSKGGDTLYFAAQDRGCTRIYQVAASGGEPKALTEGATDHDPVVTPDGKAAYFVRETLVSPPEIMRLDLSSHRAVPVTGFNEWVAGDISMENGEAFWFEGATGEQVQGLLVRPPQFQKGKRYPVVFLIHGGPQGMFGRDFHERWNAQLFAARGWVTVMINPRGSTGYGQAFVDAIRGQWGGDCYQDLIKGFDYVLDTYPFCDGERTAAAGASFGGYMVDWLATQTNRFKCLVSHDGIFNTEMMNWLTDELWFTEWEFQGLPWESPEAYRKYSPHTRVKHIETPMLLIQGEQDFRCVTAESLGLFTALRRRGIRARLLYFPDEGHWVQKPKNRQVWYQTVLDWLGEHLEGA